MKRSMPLIGLFFVAAEGLLAGCMLPPGPALVRDGLEARYRDSRVEVQSQTYAGRVFNPGTILILQADSVPAKRFRVVQRLQPLVVVEKSFRPKWTRFHVRDYALVTIAADGRRTAAPGDFTLNRGTRLVVLDLKIKAERIHLFTHTLEPVETVRGQDVYGCTEFAFFFDPRVLEQGDLSTVQSRVDQWLALASAT